MQKKKILWEQCLIKIHVAHQDNQYFHGKKCCIIFISESKNCKRAMILIHVHVLILLMNFFSAVTYLLDIIQIG